MPKKSYDIKEETRFRIQKVIDAVDGRIAGLSNEIPAEPPVAGTPAEERVAVAFAKREMAEELKKMLLEEFHADLLP